MTRFPDWEKKLHRICQERMHMPFAFGSNDCTLFVMDAILAMTGTDLGAAIRGTYSDKSGAASVLTEEKLSAIAEANGIEQVPIKFARRGDAVMMIQDGAMSMGIVSLDGIRALFTGNDGLERFPVLECHRAWRIG